MAISRQNGFVQRKITSTLPRIQVIWTNSYLISDFHTCTSACLHPQPSRPNNAYGSRLSCWSFLSGCFTRGRFVLLSFRPGQFAPIVSRHFTIHHESNTSLWNKYHFINIVMKCDEIKII